MAPTRKSQRKTRGAASTQATLPNGAMTTVFQVSLNAPVTQPLPERPRGRRRRQPQPDVSVNDGNPPLGPDAAAGVRVSHPDSQIQEDVFFHPTPRSPEGEVINIDVSPSPPATPTPLDRRPSHPHVHFEPVPTTPNTPPPNPTVNCIPGRPLDASPKTPRRRRQNKSSNNGPAGNKKGNRANDVWGCYEESSGDKTVACVFCRKMNAINPRHKIQQYSGNTGTTVLRKHLFTAHQHDWSTYCRDHDISIRSKAAKAAVAEDGMSPETHEGPAGDGKPRKRRFTPEGFVDALVAWLVSDDQSINVIENVKLREILLMLRDDLKDTDIPHRSTLRNRIEEVLDDHFDELEKAMNASIGKISMTTDLWTDPNMVPYMAVTAHWIEATTINTTSGSQYSLKYRADLIGFIQVPTRHTGDHMANAFMWILERINIAHKIGWVTLDNASNNDTFMTTLASLLQKKNIPFSATERRIRCFPHIVNLACKAVLTAVTAMEYSAFGSLDYNPAHSLSRDPVATVRQAIRVIRVSSYRRTYFNEIKETLKLKDLQLLRDVDTRWSSTLLMIDRAIELRAAVDEFFKEGGEFPELQHFKPTNADWSFLKSLSEVLEIPHAFQQWLSFEKTPTLAYTIPTFHAMIEAWEMHKIENPLMADIIDDGIDKLDVYSTRISNVPAYTLAMILDPQTKLDWLRQVHPEEIPEAKELLYKELRAYTSASTNRPETASNVQREDQSTVHQAWIHKVLKTGQNNSTQNQVPSRSIEQEVESYLLEQLTSGSILEFWQVNQKRYPTLFQLAMDILPIQASAVPCERVFSSAKETVTPRRNRIEPELMEDLQVLKFAFNHGNLDFTTGLGKDDELEALETIEFLRSGMPEDLPSFLKLLL